MNEIPVEVLANASPIYAGLIVENGKPYSPSNGTEGLLFMGAWCYRCTKENDGTCGILNAALCGDQPEEWQYYDNCPICTAFEPA